jgi:hypothetical protein
MNIRSVFAGALLLSQILTSYGQTNSFIVPPGLILPKDSATQSALFAAFDGFLSQKDKPAKENAHVLKAQFLETSVLLDEMKHIEENTELKQPAFYKCYLTNVMPLNDNDYLIQCSYLGVNGTTPMLRASFTLVATKDADRFHFSSPLKQNSLSWKSETLGNTTFHFKSRFNSANAKTYLNKIAEYDKRLNAPTQQPTDLYCCDNFHEVLQLVGIDYKADYNGYSRNTLSAAANDTNLVVDGTVTSDFTKFDPHDLWHERLHRVLSPDLINRPVDEGCAYLYGGSWGLSWKEILGKFKAYAAANENADWLSLYNESKNFTETADRPTRVDYAINALLVQKIEKEKGFPAVLELLSCGKKEADNANYFKALEKITGISKADFTSTVGRLINAAE